ncbi:MAG TPA: prepilin-type N-terminal cleavage/methylation domain-containing protein [Limnobacter sp.]|uniref:pilus assembly FimT family protein n=1 Tax=Limnobacter sp. TaxID=2003368 RepID=UPI002EDB7F99
MDNTRQNRGFTVLELLIVLAISAVAIGFALPSMDGYVARQQLKQIASQITAHLQSARSMSASTECRSTVDLLNANGTLNVQVMLTRDSQWKGCARWFEANGLPYQNQVSLRSAQIPQVTLDRNLSLSFQGVSGSLDSTTSSTFQLSSRGYTAQITLDGIGNGVLSYVN